MPTRKNRKGFGLLDTVIILTVAFTADLFLLWIASQILGLNLFEHLPGWLTALSKSIWSYVTGVAGSILLGFLRRRLNTTAESPNYLLWSGGTAIAILVALTLLMHIFPPGLVGGAARAGEFDLKFHLREPANRHPPFAVKQTQPKPRRRQNQALQADNYYHASGDLPSPCKGFEASAYAVLTESELVNDPVSPPMVLSFLRSPKDPEKAPLEVLIECEEESKRCKISQSDYGWASEGKDCEGSSNSWLPGFVVFAYSEGQSRGSVQPGWRVPSLETLSALKGREKVGYTEFLVKSKLPQSLRQADSFRYSIRVNGTPIYIDGSRPEDMIEPLEPSEGLNFAFGLENLNFSGADRGCENISVRFEFQKQGQVIQSAEASRKYAALRDAELEEIQSKGGIKFSWSGKYVKPEKEDRFEVFIRSTPDVTETTSIKARLDRAKLRFRNSEVFGVIRPPLNQNAYGVVVGLLQPTGQIRFTFDKEVGYGLLNFMREVGKSPNMSSIIQQNVFLYQMKPGESGAGELRACSSPSP